MANFEQEARRLIAAGFIADLLPILPHDANLSPLSAVPESNLGKVPGKRLSGERWVGFQGWQDHIATEEEVMRWCAWGAGIGVNTRNLAAVDVDVLDETLSARLRGLLVGNFGYAPVRTGNAPKCLLLYRVAEPHRKMRIAFRLAHTGETKHAVEILGEGQQFVAFGIHPKTKSPYCWSFGQTPADKELTTLTPADIERMRGLIVELLDSIGALDITIHDGTASGQSQFIGAAEHLASDPALAVEALLSIPNESLDRETWIGLAHAFKAAVGGGEEHYEAFENWCLQYPDNTPDAARRLWDSITASTVGAARLFDAARGHGFMEDMADEFAPLPEDSNDTCICRTEIRYTPDRLVESVDLAMAAMIADVAQGQVFAFGNELVTVQTAQPLTVRQLAGGECPKMKLIVPFDAHALRERLMRSCRFFVHDARTKAWRATMAPDALVQMALSRRGRGAPPLTGLLESPTLRPDGSLIATPGYDATTGLFAVFEPGQFPNVPAHPTKEEALSALAYLRDEVFTEFPFAEAVDSYCAVALLLTAVVRRSALGQSPAFAVCAPIQSSGKTSLVSLIASCAFGRAATAATYPDDEAEMRKRLFAILREGHALAVFDNLRHGQRVSSETLALALTSETFSDRVLGVSRTATVPSSLLVVFTGNGLAFVEDFASRVLPITLAPDIERPEQRVFRRKNLDAWAAVNRPTVVAACLTILLAYQVAGCPEVGGKPTRFFEWARMVRDPLLWLGSADLAVKFERSAREDPQSEQLGAVYELWSSVFGDAVLTARAVIDNLKALAATRDRALLEDVQPEPRAAKGGELLAMLSAQASARKGALDAQALGLWLRKHASRIVGGRMLLRVEDKHLNTATWAVKTAPSS